MPVGQLRENLKAGEQRQQTKEQRSPRYLRHNLTLGQGSSWCQGPEEMIL
jgi:hypothetical protein